MTWTRFYLADPQHYTPTTVSDCGTSVLVFFCGHIEATDQTSITHSRLSDADGWASLWFWCAAVLEHFSVDDLDHHHRKTLVLMRVLSCELVICPPQQVSERQRPCWSGQASPACEWRTPARRRSCLRSCCPSWGGERGAGGRNQQMSCGEGGLWPVLTCPGRFDPDILVGYEVQMHSWGYLLQRAAVLGVDLCQQLSRVPGTSRGRHIRGPGPSSNSLHKRSCQRPAVYVLEQQNPPF